MRSRFAALAVLLFPSLLSASYTYYATDTLQSANNSAPNFYENGSSANSSSGFSATTAGGGAYVAKSTAPDGTHQYEVAATLNLASSGGTYVLYLQASADALLGSTSTGSFYSVAITNPTFSGTSCTAQAAIYKTVAGSVSQVSLQTVPCAHTVTYHVVWGVDSQIRLWVNGVAYNYWNDPLYWSNPSAQLSGNPGVGGYSMPAGNSISLVQLGPCDRIAPAAVDPQSVENFIHAGEVDIETAGSHDDPNGAGVNVYLWYRDGARIAASQQPAWSDAGATAGASHNYGVYVQDFHGNLSNATNFTLSVPANSSIDALETGVRTTGSYWGGLGEQIDVRSGNLNFSYPLVKAISRGWSVPLGMVYNSQNWRLDSGGHPWRIGQDVGFGFGWTMQLGSLTGFYSDLLQIKFYVFTDATGATYRLDQNNGGVWTSGESVYVAYDSNAQQLYFNNGMHWILGCISAGTEEDAGTMYPTLLEDSNGNQIKLQYASGLNVTWVNSSARITSIQDVRPGVNPPGATTFWFSYNNDAIPHLTGIANAINSQDSFAFTYNAVTLAPPFGTSGSFGTAGLLSSAKNNATNLTTDFTYDTGNSGELQQVTFPLGGHMRWQYATAAYTQTTIREVETRYLLWDSTIGERSYGLAGTRNSAGTMDISRVLTDNTAGATKTWTFNDVQAGSPISGLVNSVSEGGGSQAPRVTSYTWAQNASASNYIARLRTTLDSGTGNAVTKQVDQTVDGYGNVTQTKLYDYSDLTNPAKTYNTTYLTTAGSTDYTSLYIRNRRLKVTVTDKGGTTTTLKQNTYDQYPNGIASTANVQQQDSTGYGPSYLTRGNIYDEAVPWGSWHHTYDQTGTPLWTGNDINPNHYVQQATSTTTNYAVPHLITTADSLNTNYGWTASLHGNSQIGANQDTSTVLYDTADRPQTVASPYGANTTYQYNTSAPQIIATTNNHWVKSYLDGLGRMAQIQTGDNTGAKSVVDVAYDAVGALPAGKVVKRSVPHLAAGTTYWNVSSYDVLGRLKSRTRPDGSSTSTYAYTGNNTTVTDPSGKWKTYTTDAYGQLVQVQEPTPHSGTEPNHVTLYSYDVFGHLTQVRMDRTVGGSVRTQYRTWAYNPATLQLTSKSSPEAGTVSYTYNSDGTLATVTDAKSQRKVYSYDSYGRITQIARGTVSGGTFTEDTTQRTTYTYSGTNGGFSTATAGRVSQITYSGPHGLAFKEWYTYHKAGAITAKRLNATGTPFGTSSLNLDASYGYDNEGSVTSILYPNSQFNSNNTTTSGPVYGYTYDTMERLLNMTDQANTSWVTNTAYGPSNELLSFTANGFSETRTYNANVELIELLSGANVHFKYNYSATQDNGQILSQTDVVSGEVTTYQYDTLQRLIQASATGYPSGPWSQSFTYDGFGNLNQITSSNAPALSVAIDTTTNRIQTSAGFDSNGNMTGYSGSSYAYDSENRLKQANPSSGGTVLYGYDSTNQRVYKGAYNGSTYSAEEIYFYGAEGRKYGTWQINPSSGVLLKASVTKQWFGDRLVSPQDHLDSRGKYFPFGQERTNVTPANPPNDQEKFASYTRDSATGLDYADQRYYNSLIGRFIRPDPFGGSANASVPQSWNRYAYVGNDPANSYDPQGLYLVDCVWDGCPGLHGEGGGGGGGDYSGSVTNSSQISAGPLAQPAQQSEAQYTAAVQQTTTDVSYANAANQAIANGNPATASLLAALDPNIVPVPVAPTTPDPVYNSFAGMASSLGIGPDTGVVVNYQQLGTAVSVQAINPFTQAPYQLSDLSFDPASVATADPALISMAFHGNSSWYLGSATNALHIVDFQQPPQGSYFQPGLQWHIDAYNPMFGLPNFLQHIGSEVIPGHGIVGSRGQAICSVSGGCQ